MISLVGGAVAFATRAEADTRVATGGNHSLAIMSDESLWAWGHNGNGEVGVGDFVWHWVPVKIESTRGWNQVAAGNQHSLGIKTDGSLWA